MQRRKTEKLSNVLSKVLQNNGIQQRLLEKHIIESWGKILGKGIEDYTTSLYIDKGMLYAKIRSSVLRHELFLEREKILNLLNEHAGRKVIYGIVFR